MEIENVQVSEIKAYGKNPKTHPETQIERIAKSIKEFGFNVPILIDKSNNLIAGHGRLLAAKKLELTEVPAIRIENLTEAQVKAYRIADNKTAESDWEYDFLSQELIDLKDSGFDLSLIGFTEKELNDLVIFQDDFKRPLFDDIIDKFRDKKGLSAKNENWFYVEYYGDNKTFEELGKILPRKGKSVHEIDPEWFAKLVRGYERAK